MAAISGLLGSITYANGYTTLVDSWGMIIAAAPQDLTPLSPTSNHQQLLTAGLLQGAGGQYTCKLAVDAVADADMGGAIYDTNPHEWVFNSTCEAREITPFGASWRTYIDGLKTTSFIMTSYIDDTTVLPLAGSAGTATLTVTTGVNYSVPYVIQQVQGGVSAADEMRRIAMACLGSSLPTANGSLPLAGTTGAATFVAKTGRQYSGTILVVGCVVAVNRPLSVGTISVDFVVNGAVTPG